MPRWLGLVLRLAGTAAGLIWIALAVPLGDAKTALAKIPASAFVIAFLLVLLNVAAGVVRWRVLMRAYGAVRIPPMGRAARLFLVAFFYNNYLPGAVAGDVGRGVATHDAFAEEGATGALAVVLVERALGLFALFALLAVGLVLAPSGLDTGMLWWWTVAGTAGSCVLVACIPVGRRLAKYLPRPLAKVANRLPEIADWSAFGLAIALSIITQLAVALAGWVLLAAVGPIDLGSSLLLVPLAAATTFLPITVGGAGAREAVYVAIGGSLFALPRADALAASLGLWFAHLAVGLIGAAAQLFGKKPPAD